MISFTAWKRRIYNQLLLMQNKSCTTYYCLSCLSHYLQIFFCFQLVQDFFQQSQVFTATHLRQLSSRALVGTTIARLLPTLAPRFGNVFFGMSDFRFGSLTGTVGWFFLGRGIWTQPFWYMTDSADPPMLKRSSRVPIERQAGPHHPNPRSEANSPWTWRCRGWTM